MSHCCYVFALAKPIVMAADGGNCFFFFFSLFFFFNLIFFFSHVVYSGLTGLLNELVCFPRVFSKFISIVLLRYGSFHK